MSLSRPGDSSPPVAIVGIGCRFPGGVTGVEELWKLLTDGRDVITDIPRSRIDLHRFFEARQGVPGKMATRWGGFLDDIEKFDAEFFRISPREAERIDPQHRLLLEVAWEALEDAGLDLARLNGAPVGVFIGQWISDFENRVFADPKEIDFYLTQGTGRYAGSGRLSYALGLRGPSLTIDTACSSSLVAVHLAVQSLRRGESILGLAGGVNVILQPQISIAYSQSGMMAADGRCKFGDARADGYVRSEGVGLVLLKLLDRALADGDRIYAVIRGSAINNDGCSSGSMGSPSRVGQEELLRMAYRDAAIAPSAVSYVEAHGTGTRAGDPVEVDAIASVLGTNRPPDRPIYLGSIKTNIGHCEGAAGVAGLIKAALILERGEIPPSLHCDVPNPAIAWADRQCEIVRAARSWSAAGSQLIAGVSAFGISGTNAHVVLEPAQKTISSKIGARSYDHHVLPLSTRSDAALRQLAQRYVELLRSNAELSLEDLCWSAATRRTALSHRVGFVAARREDMVEALQSFAHGEPALAEGVVASETPPKIALVCPGQGGQWTGMARRLMADEPEFLSALETCDRAARNHVPWSIIEQLAASPGSGAFLLDRIDVIQPTLVALAIAYARLWLSYGIRPDAVVGHSMGEIAAACIAGVLTVPDAMRIACHRSELMRSVRGQGAMALVDLPRDEVATRLSRLGDRVAVAASNSPRSSVISGDPELVHRMLTELEHEKVFCRPVNVDVASHSRQMEPLAVQLSSYLDGLEARPSSVPIYSTVFGRRADGLQFDAKYWGRNLREPVLFADAISEILGDGITSFVELGPHPILTPAVEQTAQSLGLRATVVATTKRDEPERASVLVSLSRLWATGHAVNWQGVMPGRGNFVPLPSYPWQKKRHWTPAADISPLVPSAERVKRPDEESLGWIYSLRWEELPTTGPGRAREGDASWLVVSADSGSRSVLANAFASAGIRADIAALDQIERAIEGWTSSARSGIVVVAPDNGDAPYLPVRLLQAALKIAAPPRLWFITRGAHNVSATQRLRVSVDQAALWGAARVVAEEHPDCWGGLIDLDPTSSIADAAAQVLQHIVSPDGEDQIAFRSGRRYALRLMPVDDGDIQPTAFTWRSDATYLISGGLGDVGLHTAREMAARGARRLVLLNRTPLPPRGEWGKVDFQTSIGKRVAAVRELERAGVSVHAATIDVGDEEQVRAFLDRYTAEGWPPIRGVIHAAGLLDNRLASLFNREAFDSALAAKLGGARILDRLLPDLDLFVLCSSTGAFLAQPGQANYAAANAGLDALARDRWARGLPALSIGWGVWAGTGLVRGDAGQKNVAELQRQGIGSFSPEHGRQMFNWLLGCAAPTVAVLPIDWRIYARARAGRDLPLFKHLLRSDQASTTGKEIVQRLGALHGKERQRLLDGIVRDAVGKVLKISPSRLDPRKVFGDLGLNSLMAMELRNHLETALARSLPATLVWNYPTVDALSMHLAAIELSSVASEAKALSTDEPAPDLVHAADLSDEDAIAALRREGMRR